MLSSVAKKSDTYCPTKASGGLTKWLCKSVRFDISKTHNCTVGFAEPGWNVPILKNECLKFVQLTVGYRTVFEAGNEGVRFAALLAANPDSVLNHGKFNIPTSLSLNVAYNRWVLSCELHKAWGFFNTSSKNKLPFNHTRKYNNF